MTQQGKTVHIWLLLCIFTSMTGLCWAISLRKIYTLFTTKKTWNEARAICENQLGQLIKVTGDSPIEEIHYLDSVEWGNRINNELSTSGIWSGLHMPFSNMTWTHQDCEHIGSGVTVGPSGIASGKCAVIMTNYAMQNDNCNNKKMFVCQRNAGDCWYEPYFEEEPLIFANSDAGTEVHNVTDPSSCAVHCRNYYDTNSASSLDTKTYDSFVNTAMEPDTICSTTPYSVDEPASDVCFCSTKEHPPIPTPISSEDKAKQYEKELSIDSSNTSSALRKLTSAEDNRPSAVGVGFMGVGLLTAVFGGLFLLDLNVLLSGLKSLLCSTESTVVARDTDC